MIPIKVVSIVIHYIIFMRFSLFIQIFIFPFAGAGI